MNTWLHLGCDLVLRAHVMRRISVHSALVLGIASCSVRTQTQSEAGHEFAVRLCAIQNDCGCPSEVLIPDCEARVEREFAENERRARNAGLVYDSSCMQEFLERVDALGTCETMYTEPASHCFVYGADADVGEPCGIFDVFPVMYSCRFGLSCIDGVCTDFVNRPRLPEGAVCSEDQHIVPTGDLGDCDDGLQCDSIDTRTCIPVPVSPKVPLGEECTSYFGCEDRGICRPQGDDLEPTEERPGICVERTPPGEPCTLVYECDRICENGFCQVAPPLLCEALQGWWDLREWY
jgi:hypothetical protein